MPQRLCSLARRSFAGGIALAGKRTGTRDPEFGNVGRVSLGAATVRIPGAGKRCAGADPGYRRRVTPISPFSRRGNAARRRILRCIPATVRRQGMYAVPSAALCLFRERFRSCSICESSFSLWKTTGGDPRRRHSARFPRIATGAGRFATSSEACTPGSGTLSSTRHGFPLQRGLLCWNRGSGSPRLRG